ncbi:MAG: NAD(P)H-hydrate epimerase [Bacteroidota bacterium]
MHIPRLTTEQMIEVDRLMIEEYKIELIQMMENAGRGLARLARERFLDNHPTGKKITILAGTGGNGGGALVAARRLHAWGARVEIVLTKEREKFTPIPAHQLSIVERLKIPIFQIGAIANLGQPDLILDGIIGYSVQGNPRGSAREMIDWANEQPCPILSLDTPSGLNLTNGTLYSPIIKAAATLTLALPKHGLFETAAKKVVGELYLADISVPPQLYTEPSLGMEVSSELFSKDDLIRIE